MMSRLESRTVLARSPVLKSIEQMVVDAGIAPKAYLRLLRADVVQSPDPQRSLNNFHRFLSSGFAASLLRDFHQHRPLQQLALQLFSQSQYLADILVRDPELFRWLTTTDELHRTKDSGDYWQEVEKSISLFSRTEKKLDALKRLQRRELLRIGAREILQEADVAVTSAELAALAEAIVEAVVELAVKHLLEGYAGSFVNTFAVIGLGKLGGKELNFSSDIDLMFVYGDDGEIELPRVRVRTLHEFYTRVAELAVQFLTQHTAEGHLYRVDLRLRPEGGAGPLVLSRAGYRTYYETRGELWERQMLTKARVIAGNREVGEKLLSDLRPFIYPRTHATSPLQEIAAIKRKIEEKTDRSANIKLGSGGIRDVEFIIQALQLLYGGTVERVRERNTLRAIDCLSETSLLGNREGEWLKKAYRFFRLVEHRLQLLYGMQTHSLPETPEEAELLARRLGFRTAASFTAELAKHRQRVRRIFTSVFVTEQRRSVSVRVVQARQLRRFYDPRLAAETLEQIHKAIAELHDSALTQPFVSALLHTGAPDWALQNFRLLAHQPLLRRSLVQILSNRSVLDLLLLVCARSRRMTELLAREPLLFEIFVGRPDEVLSGNLEWNFLRTQDLRRFQQFNEFRVLLRWLCGHSKIQQTTYELSTLADTILMQRIEETARRLDVRTRFALVALGKYGGSEITFGSDLDVVVVYRKQNDASAVEIEKFARALSESLTVEGVPVYDLDMRLRPEGKNAPLGVEIDYFRMYLQQRASLWERQSLVKARMICGDEELSRTLTDILVEAAYSAALPKRWVREIVHMRKMIERERSTRKGIDLKVGKGGLVDLEFAVQALQLGFGRENDALRLQNTFACVEAIEKVQILPTRECRRLQANLEWLRAVETAIRLNSETTDLVVPTDTIHLQALAAAVGEKSTKGLLYRIRKVQKANRSIMLHSFRRCKLL
jgi:glutamate-ammonia-ligase adenylyltransferase